MGRILKMIFGAFMRFVVVASVVLGPLMAFSYGPDLFRMAAGHPRPDQALIQAAMFGDVQGVRWALERRADCNARCISGNTPLFWAAEVGSVGSVRLLLSHGADLDVVGDIGWTALHAAAANGHIEVVQLLLQHGADPDGPEVGEARLTPIDAAGYYGHWEVRRVLVAWSRRPDNTVPETYVDARVPR